jgi:hypothetical protein
MIYSLEYQILQWVSDCYIRTHAHTHTHTYIHTHTHTHTRARARAAKVIRTFPKVFVAVTDVPKTGEQKLCTVVSAHSMLCYAILKPTSRNCEVQLKCHPSLQNSRAETFDHTQIPFPAFSEIKWQTAQK